MVVLKVRVMAVVKIVVKVVITYIHHISISETIVVMLVV